MRPHTPVPNASYELRPDGRTRSSFHWQFLVRGPTRARRHAAAAGAVTLRSPKMARAEAALFVAEGPLSARKLAQFATLADGAEAAELVERLNAAYDRDGSAFRIERIAAGYQMMTRPQYAYWLDKLHQRQTALKLSPPALETLTIVAYRQPITRADVEAIRGVQCADMLKQLMDRGIVRIGGEDDSLGRPYLYETTRRFLELFGLRSLDDLPLAETLRKPAGGSAANGGVSGNAPAGESQPSTDQAAVARLVPSPSGRGLG